MADAIVEYIPLMALPVISRVWELEELMVAPDSTAMVPPVVVIVKPFKSKCVPEVIRRSIPEGIVTLFVKIGCWGAHHVSLCEREPEVVIGIRPLILVHILELSKPSCSTVEKDT